MKLPRRRFLQLAASAAALPAISGENQMPTATLSQAELTTMASCPANYFLENFTLRADKSALITTVASFPANYFLENLVLRADNSALVTAMNRKELWYVPPAAAADTVTPILLRCLFDDTPRKHHRLRFSESC